MHRSLDISCLLKMSYDGSSEHTEFSRWICVPMLKRVAVKQKTDAYEQDRNIYSLLCFTLTLIFSSVLDAVKSFPLIPICEYLTYQLYRYFSQFHSQMEIPSEVWGAGGPDTYSFNGFSPIRNSKPTCHKNFHKNVYETWYAHVRHLSF